MSTPKFTLVLDSSQLTTKLECPMLWNYKNKERLTFPKEDERDAMNAGTYGHQLLDIYYTCRVKGVSFNDSVTQALTFNPDTDFKCKCGHLKKEHNWTLEPFGIGPAGCDRCTTPICKNFDPVPFELSAENRFAVVNRLRDYFFKYQANDFIPDSEKAIEVGFSEPIYEDAENLFVLEGRIDLIGTWQGLPTIVDHKFQMKSHKLLEKSIQFRNYDLVCQGKTNMLTINYIRLSKSVGKGNDNLERVPVTFTSVERAWWKTEVIKMFFDLKQQIQSGLYRRNWASCGGQYGRPCMYIPLCHEVHEDIRELKKSQLFVIKEQVWRPW